MSVKGLPAVFNNLAAGPHKFTVVAVDTAGNKGPTPASFSWTILQHKTTLTTNSIADRPWNTPLTVTGKLTDSETGSGITGKIITFTGTGTANLASATTNADGTYAASGITPSTVATGLTVQAHLPAMAWIAQLTLLLSAIIQQD